MAGQMKHTEVMIVGAGPSGLMMAAQLLRYGIVPVIIDLKTGPDKQSRALAIQARSMEIFRQLGIERGFEDSGLRCDGFRVQERARILGTVDFSDITDAPTRYPHILILPQHKTERLLIERLTKGACPIRWGTEIISLAQNDQGVRLSTRAGETEQEWQCNWLIGADGVTSFVRQTLAIPFSGHTYPASFFLADIRTRKKDNNLINIFLTKKRTFLGVFPVDGDGNYRLVGVLPNALSSRQTISYGDVAETVDNTLGFQLPVAACHWISRFTVHKRIATEFRKQRCFLIGDAAHTHSPVAGQGMNTGLQDAANLAWKLAGVINGRIKPTILHSYEEERVPEAKQTLTQTDRVFGLIASGRSWLYRPVLALLPFLLRQLNSRKNRKRQAFSHISQTGIHYRNTQLAVHHSSHNGVKAGDRLPYLAIYDEKTTEMTDLHAWCRKPGFILLIIGSTGKQTIHLITQWMTRRYPGDMHLFYLPYSAKNQQIFDTFEIKPEQMKMVLIRPDMHIAYMNDLMNIGLIDTYMEEVLGWIIKKDYHV